MNKNTSKYLVLSAALLVFSILLASCQSMIANTEAMDRKQAVDAWGANLTAQGESYLEEMEQAGIPLVELRSDVPAEAEVVVNTLTIGGENYYERYLKELEQASIPLVELRSDVPAEAEVMADASSPGIKIQRTWLEEKAFLTVYSVTNDGPAWVVFHADEYGVPGRILEYVWVGSGTHSFARTEILEEINSEKTHIMLHQDLARIGEFEFPAGPDGPVFVDNEIVNELCFCPF